jgi:hypothetical protein
LTFRTDAQLGPDVGEARERAGLVEREPDVAAFGLVELAEERGMAILATSGREWADRTKLLAARVPDLDIFSHRLVERFSGGWQITAKGRAVLEFMEARPAAPEPLQASLVEEAPAEIVVASQIPPLRQPAERAKRRRERRERRREARE